MADKFGGIGMNRRQADNFKRELITILFVVPIIIIVSAMGIGSVLQSAIGTTNDFPKYILGSIGILGWIVVLYKKYMNKIIDNI